MLHESWKFRISSWNKRFISNDNENTELAVKSRELELINKIASTEFNKSDFSYDLSKRKIETYILNTAHPRGGTKAKFFIETLGYSKSNSKEFYDNLAEAIDKKIPSKVTRTQYGIVCEKNKGC